MPHCDINLAKGIIWSRWKRLLAYRLLIVYFFVVALLLAASVGRAVQKVFVGIQYYRQSRELEQRFVRLHPNDANLLSHAKGLRNQLEKDAARIESINQALPPAIHTPLPALVLLANQPGNITLHRFAFSQQTENEPVLLRFDLITPVSSTQGTSFTSAFLEKWQSDPLLAQQFPDIKQVQVRRAELASGPVFITQYEALSKD